MNKYLEYDIKEIIKNKDFFTFLNEKTILVTGATGMIGSMLIKSIFAANSEYKLNIKVIGYVRDLKKAEFVFGKLYNCAEFVTDMNVKCDYIIHTISPTASKFFINYPVETIKSSVLSTIDALEVAKYNNATMVYLSSMEQYGIPYNEAEKMTEDKIGIINHLDVRSSYSESKRLCECLCISYSSEYSVNVKIVRLAQTFGAGESLSDNRMPMQFAKAVVEGRDIVLHTKGKAISNFVYLTDAVVGILMVLEHGISGEAYNVCNDKETQSVVEIAELVATQVANGEIKVKIEKKSDMGYAPDTTMYLDSNKIMKLGWKAKVGMVDAYNRLIGYIIESATE